MRLAVVATVSCVGLSLWGCAANPAGVLDQPVRVVHAVVSGADDRAPREDAALAALLQWVRSDSGPAPAAVVLVTNFGFGGAPPPAAQTGATQPPPQPAAGQSDQTEQRQSGQQPADAPAKAKRLATILQRGQLGIPVYLVPGVWQLGADETPASALTNWRSVVRQLQSVLTGPAGSSQVIDLTACYQPTDAHDSGSGCVAHLGNGRVRLVAYPGFFVGPANKALADVQIGWVNTFTVAMDAVAPEVTTILVASLSTPITRHWPSEAVNTWMRAASNARIALGVEGSPALRRAAYETNTLWKAPVLFGQWLITPPLTAHATAGSQTSQGLSVVSVSPRGVTSRDMFWYSDSEPRFTGQFGGDASSASRSVWARLVSPVTSLWWLGDRIADPLSRAAVFFIAMLAAFLTSVAVWQIPTPTSAGITASAGQSPTPETGAAPTLAKTALLDQNFARTVISGLGGLAVATLMLDTFGAEDSKGPSQQFYVVWFIVWFFIMLFVSSGWKSWAEGLRVTSYLGRPLPNGKRRAPRRWFWLTFSDAFFNLIQGRNELKSTLWADEIRTAQLDVLLAIDRICEHLRAAVVDYLTDKADGPCKGAAIAPQPGTKFSEDQQSPSLAAESSTGKGTTIPDTTPEPSSQKESATQGGNGTAGAQPEAVTGGKADAEVTTTSVGGEPPEARQDAEAPPNQSSGGNGSTAPPADADVAAGGNPQSANEVTALAPSNTQTAPNDGAATGGAGCLRRRRIEMSDVRVAVSLLSDDKSRVYYVSWPPESSSRDFDKKSMAYVTAASGRTLWWQEGYKKENVVLDNTVGSVAELEKKALTLEEYFPHRGRDYKAFVLIPIPTRPTAEGRRAVLHISFKAKEQLGALWGSDIIRDEKSPEPYERSGELIDETPAELRRLLRQSINVIESLLKHFNEDVFVNALHSRRRF